MRFIHTADIHLGAAPDGGRLYDGVREREIWDTFARLLKVCEQEQADVLFIAGDLFHRQPLMRELKEVNALFSALTRTKVVLIAGNHDWVNKDSCYRRFSWNENVYPLMEERQGRVVLEELQLAVYGFGYEHREITEPLYDHWAAPGEYPYEILLAHGGDSRHVPINK